MLKSRKTTIGIAALVALGLVGALGAAALSSRVSFASPLAQATPVPGSPVPGQKSQYQEFFLNAFATRLGVTVEKLKSAFIDAAGDTTAKAVQDGNLTQAEADRIQQKVTDSVNSGKGIFFGWGKHRGWGGIGVKAAIVKADFAKALGMSEQDLTTELRAGKSIADVAQERNIDRQQVKQSVLADVKTRLDGAVTAGQLTQAQADQAYQRITGEIDALMDRKGLGKGFGHHP